MKGERRSLARRGAAAVPGRLADALGGGVRRDPWLGDVRASQDDVSNIGQTRLSTAAHDLSGRKAEAPIFLPLSKS